MSEVAELPITIYEAKCLMEILDKDIPEWNKSKIALLLLILSANPSLVKEGEEILTSKFGRTARCYSNGFCGENDYCEDY